MTNRLNEQLAWLAAHGENVFTVYKHSQDGKVLIKCDKHISEFNAIQENVSILSNAPIGSTVEETMVKRNHHCEDVGDEFVNCWQLKIDRTWERI